MDQWFYHDTSAVIEDYLLMLFTDNFWVIVTSLGSFIVFLTVASFVVGITYNRITKLRYDLEALKLDNEMDHQEMMKKIDPLVEDVSYIRGKVDSWDNNK